jgi:adenylate cyclase
VRARRLRLTTGLILFAYLATHLLNHALGLVSLEAMEQGRRWFLALWRNPVGTAALYGALLTHFALALLSVYRRRHLRMPAWEATQLLLGLTIPALLVPHAVGTRGAHELAGTEDSYTLVLLSLWHHRPWLGLRQAILVLVAWTHACFGLHFWLRLRPGYARVAPWLLGGGVLLPAVALLGFVDGGRQVSARAGVPGGAAGIVAGAGAPDPTQRARLDTVVTLTWGVAGVSLAAVLGARGLRHRRGRRRGVVQVTYPGGRRVPIVPGTTVLEASRLAAIPHTSICGGRGRCSTCRVRVARGLDRQPAPGPEEGRVLQRVGAPPTVRLACQLRPSHDLSVVPLVPAAPAGGTRVLAAHRAGQEREVAVLFADLRQFTRLAERRLPYDVVFFLNRYFETAGETIARAGGVVNQFTGDGIMALFGVESDGATGCRAALTAARELVQSIEGLSRELADELGGPLRIGIGIHTGPAVVGEMGHGRARYLTAVGDTVHVASRLQDLTKRYDCQLVVSEPVLTLAGVETSGLTRDEISVRNRTAPVALYVITDLRQVLPAGP